MSGLGAPAATYLHVTLKVRAGRMSAFVETMSRLKERLEARGWKLEGAWATVVGRLNVVIDLWRVPDANSVPALFAALAAEADWPELEARLAECIEDEVLQLVQKLPYAP